MEDLRTASPKELLEAYAFWAEQALTARELYFLRLGFGLAQPDGWEHIAPAWLRLYRESKQTAP